MIDSKVCTKCGELKPLDLFHRSRQSNHGTFRMSACKACSKLKGYRWRYNNPDKYMATWKKHAAIKKELRRPLVEARRKAVSAYSELTRTARMKAYSAKGEQTENTKAYRRAYKSLASSIKRSAELRARPEKKAIRAERSRERRRLDPRFRLDNRISCGVYSALRSKKSGRPWELILGFTLTDLVAHIESLFVDDMSWENMDLWEIDHILPRSAHTYTSDTDQDFKDCWRLQNLQPLWKVDNRRKRDRIGWAGKLF